MVLGFGWGLSSKDFLCAGGFKTLGGGFSGLVGGGFQWCDPGAISVRSSAIQVV